MVAVPSLSITTGQTGNFASRLTRYAPQAAAQAANGHAAQRGISEASTANGARIVIASIAPISQRDGRNSNRQGADAFDERMQFRIFSDVVTEEPAP